MERTTIDLWFGAFVLAGFGALLVLALKVGNLGQTNASSTYRIEARFDNIGGLKVRAPVKSAGVVVGRVAEIRFDAQNYVAIVGMQTRGVEIARRLKARIESISGRKVNEGIIDITFYRDDLATKGVLPVIKETRIGFDIRNMTILLVDDVIFTGRTTKAALETLTSFGRPKAIRLFVMVDRGNRELPIQPDYCGYRIRTGIKDAVAFLILFVVLLRGRSS